MSPSEVAEGIRQYTNNQGGVYIDVIREAEYVIYDVTGFVLGVIVFFIVVGMLLITALDICYITIPIFQDKVREERWDGSVGGSKFRIISNAARISVDKCASSSENPLKVYLKKRIAMYCICGVVLYVAIVGSNTVISLVANVILNILEGIRQSDLMSKIIPV